MQTLSVIGNLGVDAEVRESNGKKFVSFKVADSSKWTDQKGVEHEETIWISCIMNGEGGNVLPYLKKGVKVFVSGRPKYRLYSSEKQRCMLVSVDLSVYQVELCGGSSDAVPAKVVDQDGMIHDVSKHYWLQQDAINPIDKCFDKTGRNMYLVDSNGFITPVAPNVVDTAGSAEQQAAEEQASQQAKKQSKSTKDGKK